MQSHIGIFGCKRSERILRRSQPHTRIIYRGEKKHFDFRPVLIHGDLSLEHILVDTENDEIGGIDFADSGLGDAAYDGVDELLPWHGHKIDGSFQARHRFYRRLAPLHSVLYVLATGDVALIANVP
ncbi:phosphotransferase family protein [Alicyclobacillus mengziensis]|uniref:Phosphotransferase n=1 Tax=Alicyclobacillus mengziensis TaxID=2931921 RepID=A0A9X7VUX2_9BACL|nr:phosphotransferase [Alicyclobacillus mengziensis]QSO45654.1 phosphotransferase [Alicyclobacillus mengziensis]